MAGLVTTVPRSSPSHKRPEVIDEADVVLQEFKTFMTQTFPKASSLYEGAKWLWQDVHDLHNKRVPQVEVTALFERQTARWDKLETQAGELRKAIQDKFAKVTSVEDRVMKARGVFPNVAALSFPTHDQRVARVVYARKLKYGFQDARDEVLMMSGFPDGMLVQIRFLREYAGKIAAGEPPKPQLPLPHLTVADEADEVLQHFQQFMKTAYPKASALCERAKWLWQDVHDLRAKRAPDMEVVATLEHQAETWGRLLKDSEALRHDIDREMVKVNDVEDRVKKARGVYPNVAALGFPTPDQRLARHMYAKKFKYAFHDAKDEYAKLCGFPEGVLNKIQQVRDYTLKAAGPAAEVVDVPKASE